MKTFKYRIHRITALLFVGILILSSCTNDLNTLPIDPNEKVSQTVFGSDLETYQQALAKMYAGLAISGNKGGDDMKDVAGVDGGSQASFLRGLWNLQELPTDEAICSWTDIGIDHFNFMVWNKDNVFTKGLYYRLLYQVQLSNQFLRETTDDKLSSRGVDATVKAEIQVYRADARFMRALAYSYMLDLFRNVPFITEASPVGIETPPRIVAKDLFAYIESELLASEKEMLEPFVGYDTKNYGRANKAAAWSLLSRLYLNAETYIGQQKYNESITYSNKVLNVGYELESSYANVFKADNGKSKEMIMPIRYEGANTQTWGGMTFLICSTVPSSLRDSINALDAWQGNRARPSLMNIFKKQNNYDADTRYRMLKPQFATNIEILSPSNFKDGIPVVKYVNVNKDGSLPSQDKMAYVDFPLFRLSEIYLNYVEAVLRGGNAGGSSRTTALDLINKLRKRAYNGSANANISDSNLNLDFILDERGREFFFEAQRRTDLVRFNKLTTDSYIWSWKGGSQSGKAVDSKFNIYPIPSDDMNSNPNLIQNPGY